MKKLMIFGIIALFIGLAFIPSFNAVSISKDIEETNPVIVVHVTEIYGSTENPQYRNLANVTVKITVIPRWWEIYWSGKTHENGTTEQVNVELGVLYRVSVSKDNYMVYKDEPYQAVGPNEIKEYHVYFTMVKKTVKDSEEDCFECQSNGKTHLAEKILNRLGKNEVLSNVINLSNPQSDRPLCDLLYNIFGYYEELYVKYMDLAYTNPDGPYFWFYFSLGMTCGAILVYIAFVALSLRCK